MSTSSVHSADSIVTSNNNENNNDPENVENIRRTTEKTTTTIKSNGPKIPVDRFWLQKLIKKHCPYPVSSSSSSSTATEEEEAATVDTTTTSNTTDHTMTKQEEGGVDVDDTSSQSQHEHHIPLEYRPYVVYALAPMVEQSDLPFRFLCRKYGTNLCYTPMIHSKLFCLGGKNSAYRRKFHIHTVCSQNNTDRPLIAQLCGSELPYLIETALAIEPYVDGIDLNCGCPQNIAKRGKYGAYLLEGKDHTDQLVYIIQELVKVLSVPLSCKVRLVPVNKKRGNHCSNNNIEDESKEDNDDTCDENGGIGTSCYDSDHDEDNGHLNKDPISEKDPDVRLLREQRDESIRQSIALYTRLVDAGIHMLTIHGRTRYHKGVGTGHCDWDAIKQMVQVFGKRIPILANGSIMNQYDIYNCLQQTQADGIMSSEAILEYPPLYQHLQYLDCTASMKCHTNHDWMASLQNRMEKAQTEPYGSQQPYQCRIKLCYEYLQYAEQYPPASYGQGSNNIKVIRIHLHRLLHIDLQQVTYGIPIRIALIKAKNVPEMIVAIQQLELLHEQYHIQTTLPPSSSSINPLTIKNDNERNSIDSDNNNVRRPVNENSDDNTITTPTTTTTTSSNTFHPTIYDTWYMRHRTLVRDEKSGLTMQRATYRKQQDKYVPASAYEFFDSNNTTPGDIVGKHQHLNHDNNNNDCKVVVGEDDDDEEIIADCFGGLFNMDDEQ